MTVSTDRIAEVAEIVLRPVFWAILIFAGILFILALPHAFDEARLDASAAFPKEIVSASAGAACTMPMDLDSGALPH